MKNKKQNNGNLKENLENFIHSNTVPAVATKVILITVALGGVALGGAIIPGILKCIKDLEFETECDEKKIKNSFHSLRRRKFIKIIKEKNGKLKVKLTGKGEKKILEFIIDNMNIAKPAVWDKKWRILIFDVPVRMNSAREALRRKIKELGFYQFQGSVWFYPYSCEDEILTIAEFFEVSEYVEIITAERVLHEKELKKYFKLR